MSKFRTSRKILFVIDEVGLVDHLAAIARQFFACGGSPHVVELSGKGLPDWAKSSLSFATFVSEAECIARADMWEAIWFARPYSRVLSAEWQKMQLEKPVVYSGYGLPISKWDEFAHREFLQDVCDLILLRSASEEKRLGELGLSKKAIASGDPLLHDVISATAMLQKSDVCRTLLWAPHWSKKINGARGFYNWRWTVGPIYRHMKKYPNLALVVRAHPFLLNAESKFLRHRTVGKLFSLPNVSISDSSLIADIQRADALITDGVSIIGYYAATGKPLATTSHVLFPPPFSIEGRALVRASGTVSTPRGLSRFLASLQRDYANALRENVVPQDLFRKLFFVRCAPPGEGLAKYPFSSTGTN